MQWCSRRCADGTAVERRLGAGVLRAQQGAVRWYARLAGTFSHEILSRQPLVLYADHADFQQTNVIDGMIDESTGGVTEGMQRRVVLPLTASYQDTDHVLGHELVHAFQYDIAARNGGS